jgi:hypothetical protein
MQGARATTVDGGVAKGSWSEIFRNGLALYSALVVGGIAINATQMLVIAIIMSAIVRDIGGASFYTWAAMLYTIGAIVGGMFAAMQWWRGSFWMMAPLMLIFAVLAYWKIPDRLSREAERSRFTGVPFLRFGTLAAGVMCVAASGSVSGIVPRVLLIAAAMSLVGLTFWVDRRASDNLFSRGALSLGAPGR